MAGQLSSVMTIAGAGLLPNPGPGIGAALIQAPALTQSLAAYDQQPVIQRYQQIVAASTVAYRADLRALAKTSFPAFTDCIPVGFTLSDIYPAPSWNEFFTYDPPDQAIYSGEVYESVLENLDQIPTNPIYWSKILANDAYFTDVISQASQRVIGHGDLSRFCQAFVVALSYQQQTNEILAALGSSPVLAETFNPATGGMDTLTTGGMNQISSNLQTLSQDLAALGDMIFLGNLDDLGLPGELVAQIGRVSGTEIPEFSELMAVSGISAFRIRDLSQGINNLTSSEEKILYRLMLAVTGDLLNQIKTVLGVTTTNITNMAQLLDPRWYLPNSYTSLTCPTNQALLPIYFSNGLGWSVNGGLRTVLADLIVSFYSGPNNTNSLEELSRIIPPDQALANKAFVRALQQIKNIAGADLPAFARAMSQIETNQDLPAIQALQDPVPPEIDSSYQTNLGSGSGPNGSLLLTDIVGAPSGAVTVSSLDIMTQVLAQLALQGSLEPFVGTNGVYTVMEDTQAGDYTQSVMGQFRVVIPPGLPGAGTYGDYPTAALAVDGAFIAGLVPAAAALITTLVANNTDLVDQANQAQTLIIQELQRQATNIAASQMSINEFEAASTSAVMAFTASLHDYGTDIAPGGANSMLTAMANVSVLSGQAVLASLREGRNIQALQAAGIEIDSQLPG